MHEWEVFSSNLKLNSDKKSLVIVPDARLFLCAKKLDFSLLIGKAFSLIPPSIDITNKIHLIKYECLNLDKHKYKFVFKEDIVLSSDAKFMAKKILISKQDFTDLMKLNNLCDVSKLIGKKLIDDTFGYVGKVSDIETKPYQQCLLVENYTKKFLLPYVKEIVYKEDSSNLYANMPEGIMNL